MSIVGMREDSTLRLTISQSQARLWLQNVPLIAAKRAVRAECRGTGHVCVFMSWCFRAHGAEAGRACPARIAVAKPSQFAEDALQVALSQFRVAVRESCSGRMPRLGRFCMETGQ